MPPFTTEFKYLVEQQMDLLPIGICVVDNALRIRMWNQTLVHWTDVLAADAVDANLLELQPHLESARFLHRLKRVFELGQPCLFVPSTTHPFFVNSPAQERDNAMLLKTVVVPLGGQNARCQYEHAQISLIDVTSQYQQIQSLRKEKEQHRISQLRTLAILETAADSIITITAQGIVESFNSAAERLFGYSACEVIGKNVNMLIPSPFRENHDDYLARFLNSGIRVRQEVVGQRSCGEQFPLHLTVSEVVFSSTDGDGSSRLFTGIIRDLTEQKQAETDLFRAKETAEAANKTKTEFLANMSHEIRTPMTAILGFTDVLLDNVQEPENIDAARTIKRNGEYLINLINDILDLSKIESGKLELEQIDCSPHAIINDVTSLMQVRAEAKNVPLEIEFEGALPETIRSDPTRLRQILINLLSNAIKFTETGSIQIVVRLLDGLSEKPQLQFDVIDTGIGIAQDKIEKLFLPFIQADSSTTRQYGGTGLGLAITKRLVEFLDGTISVTSTVGKGSKFSVDIATGPLDHAKLIRSSIDSVVQTAKPEAVDRTQSSLQGIRVLLAEDGPDSQRLISFVLKKAGAEVTIADNGLIAFELATVAKHEARSFDVILMDMQMPVMDGYEATQRLREQGYVRPIIALTAHAMSGDRRKCLDAGCDDYATKPVDRKQLLNLVHSYCSPDLPELGTAAHLLKK